MSRKLFNLIYRLIIRQEINEDDAYEILSDYFRMDSSSEDEKKPKLKLQPLNDREDSDLKDLIIDTPAITVSPWDVTTKPYGITTVYSTCSENKEPLDLKTLKTSSIVHPANASFTISSESNNAIKSYLTQ